MKYFILYAKEHVGITGYYNDLCDGHPLNWLIKMNNSHPNIKYILLFWKKIDDIDQNVINDFHKIVESD